MNLPQKKRARIFILGISGFVGYNLAWKLRNTYSVTGAYFTNFVSIPDVHTFHMDLMRKDYVDRLVRMLRPDFTIMAAGVNDSKRCADNVKLGEAINTFLPLELAQSAAQNGAKNIHLSCSQVFDGTGANAKESDKHFTNQVFGRMKLTGESYIRAQTMENTTIRFGKALGPSHFRRPSYLDKVRASLATGKKHLIKEDKTYTFISIQSLVRALELVLEGDIPATHRLFHVGGPALKEIDANRLIAEARGAKPDLLVEQKNVGDEEGENLRINPKRDYSLDTSLFQATYKWKAETAEDLKRAMRDVLTPSIRVWD